MSYQALLFCPDEKTARAVTQVLTELDFSVELCNEPFATVKKLMAKQYDAIVVDCDNEQNAALLFKSARNSQSNQASLAVAVVEGQAGVAKAFRIGANLVLTKPVNVEQSKGTLRVARGLLKKAEGGKASPIMPLMAVPGGTPRPASTTIPRPPVLGSGLPTPMPFAPTGFSPKTAGLSEAVSSATFEIDEDPTPEPEPTEAAFLQSIPETHSDTPKSSSPWQLSKSNGGATELNHSAPGSNASANAPVSTPAVQVRHPFNTGRSSGSAAGAAPAREPEVLAAIPNLKAAVPTKSTPLTVETELKQSVSIPGLEEADAIRQAFDISAKQESKSSKLPLIAAIAVIAIAGAGYYGWSRMHSVPTSQPLQTNVASTQQTQATVAQPTVASPSEITPPENDPQSSKKSSQPLPKLTQSQPPDSHSAKPSPIGKPTGDEIVVVENPVSNASGEEKLAAPKKKVAETLTVKSDAAASEQQVAPPALQAQANSGDQAIAGIITSTNMPLPKRAPEVLRVSQGITEGMLIKKVAPVYPPRALQMHIQGIVEVLATIGKNGSISAARATKGDATLAGAAVAAVKLWKYKPYTLNGQAVEVQTQVMINFKLP